MSSKRRRAAARGPDRAAVEPIFADVVFWCPGVNVGALVNRYKQWGFNPAACRPAHPGRLVILCDELDCLSTSQTPVYSTSRFTNVSIPFPVTAGTSLKRSNLLLFILSVYARSAAFGDPSRRWCTPVVRTPWLEECVNAGRLLFEKDGYGGWEIRIWRKHTQLEAQLHALSEEMESTESNDSRTISPSTIPHSPSATSPHPAMYGHNHPSALVEKLSSNPASSEGESELSDVPNTSTSPVVKAPHQVLNRKKPTKQTAVNLAKNLRQEYMTVITKNQWKFDKIVEHLKTYDWSESDSRESCIRWLQAKEPSMSVESFFKQHRTLLEEAEPRLLSSARLGARKRRQGVS